MSCFFFFLKLSAYYETIPSDILDRYKDGERLTVEDEKAVVENLLAYHPHSEDKIGCGIESIMVSFGFQRSPRFVGSML